MVISLPMKLISSKSAPWDLIKNPVAVHLQLVLDRALSTTEEYIIKISVMKTYCTHLQTKRQGSDQKNN